MGLSISSLLPLRLRLWIGERLFHRLGPTTCRVSWHRVIKGPCRPPEIEAMQFVAAQTTVPVPRIHATHTENDGSIYIEMDYIKGQDLDRAWSSLPTEQRNTIFADIKQHLCSLRNLQPPTSGTVSSALQNPAYDCRIGNRFFGPLNHEEFHSLARGHCVMEDVALFLGKEVVEVHTGQYETRFTHADLTPRNILVKNGRVVAIIDWAFAGWYPEYWEFTKACYNYFSGKGWEEFLHQSLPGYEMELTAEKMLWSRLPLPGSRGVACIEGVEYRNPGSDPSAAWLNARADRPLADLWSLALREGSD